MTQQMLIKIGDRIIDLNAVTYAKYDPQAFDLMDDTVGALCSVSFGSEVCRHFNDAEAQLIWKLLSDRAVDITPTGGATA